MEQLILATSETPEIIVEYIKGDLRLTGWERNEFSAEAADRRTLAADQQGERLTFRAEGDCSLRVPRRARLSFATIGGDARLKNLEGETEITRVSGDLELRKTGPMRVGQVGGDLSAKKIQGAFTVDKVSADASVRGVAGDFTANTIGTDLYLRDVSGVARVNTVGADVVLNLAFAPNVEYRFTAGGDVLCRVRPDQSARFTLQAKGDIQVDAFGTIEGSANQKIVTLGDGAAQVWLTAGGDITLSTISADPEAMGEFGEHFGDEFGVMAEEFAAQIETQIVSQIETQMADFERQLEEKLGALEGLAGSSVNAERIAERARRAAERASEIARRKAEAMQRKAERDAERARRDAERAQRDAERGKRGTHAGHPATGVLQFGKHKFNFDFPPRPPAPPRPPSAPSAPRAPSAPSAPKPPVDPVSDEERMTILKMVEQGKITVVEAEKLLAAMEGK